MLPGAKQPAVAEFTAPIAKGEYRMTSNPVRTILIALAAILGVAGVSGNPTPANAQIPVPWVRTYPERSQPACTWIIAQWGDGTYNASAWECDAGRSAVRSDGATATRGYPQTASNGCTEYVSQWSDGTYSWVPYTCPAGVTYFKSQSQGVQPAPGGVAPGGPSIIPITPANPNSPVNPILPPNQGNPIAPGAPITVPGSGLPAIPGIPGFTLPR